MEMPRPTPHHARLAAFVGEWRGEEILHPSPWAPERKTASGRFSARIGVDGMFLITEYEEAREGAVFFRGHGVYGYDPHRERYTMFWFDSMGMSPRPTFGTWEGDTLTFENSHDHGRSRYVYAFEGPDAYTFKIFAAPPEGEWALFMEGRYRRVAPPG
ncbi:MAG: DUF1579 family protein [Myxococcales bacterium]|nr:DUF1579 family protein [Myxococcales bacterium]MCB9700534.1 DUF1579 family protein [Myxococcales bacterium]